MIKERLSEGTRRELEALTNDERQQLLEELQEDLKVDHKTLAFLDQMADKPLFDRSVDVAALIREGRRV